MVKGVSMKRIITAVLAVVALFCLAGCTIDFSGHQHVFTETVVEPTCTEKGYTLHTCSECDYSYMDNLTDAVGHDFDEWEELEPATCTTRGVEIRYCLNDEEHFEMRLTPALEHDFDIQVVPPTKTEEGYTLYTCKRCGYSLKADITEPTEHDWGEWEELNAPTCTESGVEIRYCKYNHAHYETRELEKLGHDYEITSVTADCVSEGYTIYRCKRCEDEYRTDIIDALGHEWGDWTVTREPTCSQTGVETRYCVHDNSHSESRTIGQLGHDYTEEVISPTCTERGYTKLTCKRCGETEKTNYTDALGHEWLDWEITEQPTCTQTGVETRYCARTHRHVETRDIPALEHEWGDWVVTKQPTLTETGIETRYCIRDNSHTETREIPTLEYEWSEWSITKEPTCTEKGIESRYCLSDSSIVQTREIESSGHNYEPIVKLPTCTQQGYTVYTCSKCGDSYTTDYVEKTAHNYSVKVVSPTCTEGGYTNNICTVCGHSYTSDYTEVLGHNWSEWTLTKQPTCTETGVESRYCLNDNSHVETRTVEKLPHDYSMNVVQRTCEQGGYTEYTCRNCGFHYSDDFTDPMGHNYGPWMTYSQPTCTTLGEERSYCINNHNHYLSRDIATIGHDYQTSVVPPTFYEQGYTEHICKNCGDSYKTDYVDYDYTADYLEYKSQNVYYTGSIEEWKQDAVNGTLQIEITVIVSSTKSFVLTLNKGQALPSSYDLEGYNFNGWYADSGYKNKLVNVGYMEDTEIYGSFSIKVFNIKYYKNDKYVTTYQCVYGDTIGFPYVLPAVGFKNSDWHDANGVVYASGAKVKEALTLYCEDVYDFLEIPAVVVFTENNQEIVSKVDYLNAEVSILNTSNIYLKERLTAGIRGRGNSTWEMPKKGYRIKFDKKQSLFGSSYKAKSWTLIANSCDKSLSRNDFAYSLASQLDDTGFVSMHQYVDLYLNGEYMGVYLLCDQMQTGTGRVEINESLNDPNDIGYFIELDFRAAEEGIENQDWFTFNGYKYVIKTPDTETSAFITNKATYISYIKQSMQSCVNALNAKNWSLICQLIDVNSFADSYIVHELTTAVDCGSTSVYFYKDKSGLFTAGPLWDFDISCGNDNYGFGNEYDCPPQNGLYAGTRNYWYKLLLKQSQFVNIVKQKMADYNERVITTIAKYSPYKLNGIYASYRNALERNFDRWDLMGVYDWPQPETVYTLTTVSEQLWYLYDWLTNRWSYLLSYYGVYV